MLETKLFLDLVDLVWNYMEATEAMASVTLVLLMVPLHKFSVGHLIKFSNGVTRCNIKTVLPSQG